MQPTVVFRVHDRWGDEIVFTEADVERICKKRREDITPYIPQIQTTLRWSNPVWEGRFVDSKVFYGKGLLIDPPYRGCLVAVIVRYSSVPASVRTVYFPREPLAKAGSLLYWNPREEGGT